jgi:hypothetical protein
MLYDKGWDEEVYRYINDFLILYPNGYANTGYGFVYDHLSRLSPFVPRPILDIIGYYSIPTVCDAYWDRLSYICGIRKNINISVSSDLMTNAVNSGQTAWDDFCFPGIQTTLEANSDKIINYMNTNHIQHRTIPYIDVRFYDHLLDSSSGSHYWSKYYPVVELFGGPCHGEKYKVYFIDQKDNGIVHFGYITTFCWTSVYCSRYINFLIKVADARDNIIFEYCFDLNDKKVLIHINSVSINYIEECLFYIDVFCKQHNCVVLCSNGISDFSNNSYPLIRLIRDGDIKIENSSLPSENISDVFINRPIFIKYIIDVDGLVGNMSVRDICCGTLGITQDIVC